MTLSFEESLYYLCSTPDNLIIVSSTRIGWEKKKLDDSLQEYDLELKLVHTIKRHDLCRLIVEQVNMPKDDSSR